MRHDERRIIHLSNTPNNGLPVVLIHREALLDMYNHAASKINREVGGHLIGFPAKDQATGLSITYIKKARAAYEYSPDVKWSHASFSEVETDRQCDDTIIVGWYHSHPSLGIFLSNIDKKDFKDYYPEGYQISIVVDPHKTPEKAIYSRSKWIGFFGRNEYGEDVRLPDENVQYIENPPDAALVDMPVVFPQLQNASLPILELQNPLNEVQSQLKSLTESGVSQISRTPTPVDDDQLKHWKELLQSHVRAVRVLEIKEAQMGIHLPVHEKIELEERKSRIEELRNSIRMSGTDNNFSSNIN